MTGFLVDYNSTLFMCSLYITLGIVSTFLSSLNLLIFFSNSEFRRKFVFFAAVDFGDLVDAVSYLLVGSGRLSGLLSGRIAVPISVYDCFYHRYWPHSLILGTELPAIGTLLIAYERICAVTRPATYNRIFSTNKKILFLSLLPIWAVFTLLTAGLSVLGDEGKRMSTTQHCAIIGSSAGWYSTLHFLFVPSAYLVSLISAFKVWYVRRKFAKHSSAQSKFGNSGKSHNKLIIVMVLAGSSILLVSMPSAVMIMIRWDIASFSDIIVALTYAMPGLLSVANFVINFAMRPEIRKQFFYLIGMRKDKAFADSQSVGGQVILPAGAAYTRGKTIGRRQTTIGTITLT
ncbi:hypothetical protein WR25_11497 [Diploscapter pachys]|uniref:G-protein coupled receptors family 1 profile domain-containing protein n=1 Tax=Diploscapter pachys TaxID=2018661 RepID=A0A2A2L7C3_9BILA|nr:hypothetical protein WR25_11497 [Diploscapter pachys]